MSLFLSILWMLSVLECKKKGRVGDKGLPPFQFENLGRGISRRVDQGQRFGGVFHLLKEYFYEEFQAIPCPLF